MVDGDADRVFHVNGSFSILEGPLPTNAAEWDELHRKFERQDNAN
jgi:hypothetical protein